MHNLCSAFSHFRSPLPELKTRSTRNPWDGKGPVADDGILRCQSGQGIRKKGNVSKGDMSPWTIWKLKSLHQLRLQGLWLRTIKYQLLKTKEATSEWKYCIYNKVLLRKCNPKVILSPNRQCFKLFCPVFTPGWPQRSFLPAWQDCPPKNTGAPKDKNSNCSNRNLYKMLPAFAHFHTPKFLTHNPCRQNMPSGYGPYSQAFHAQFYHWDVGCPSSVAFCKLQSKQPSQTKHAKGLQPL